MVVDETGVDELGCYLMNSWAGSKRLYSDT